MRFIASKLHAILTTDFCPNLNVYVYWLKEPVGWFCVALLSSVLVGAFLSPIGWSVAAGLAIIILLGLGFPWVATRCLRCQLQCDRDALHEGDEAHLLFSVKNPLPVPVMGLVVEGYFSRTLASTGDSVAAECGLARVPAFSTAQYRLPIQPQYRGHYPSEAPKIACAFPFGIYTARRPVEAYSRVVVRPMIVPIAAEFEWSGSEIAETGAGLRPTDHGEFLGVREFRRGDSLRSIHWMQSARQDSIIVCERGGPQKSPVAIRIYTQRCPGEEWEARENLAWRVRVAASLVDFLVARHVPIELFIDDRKSQLRLGGGALASAWDALAAIPIDTPERQVEVPDERKRGITIGPSIGEANQGKATGRYISVTSELGSASARRQATLYQAEIDLEQPVDLQLARLLQEVSLDSAAA